MEQIELRGILYSMDALQVELAYLEAARTGQDPLLEFAVEGAPKIRPLVKPKAVEAGRQARAIRNSPETARRLAALRKALQAFDSAVRSVRSSFGLPEDDLITRIAREGV